MFSINNHFQKSRFISVVFKIVLFYKPQDVVVMKSSWCEDHASWYQQTVKMVIISETVEKVKYLGTLLPGTPYGRKIEKWNIRVANA